LKSFFGHARWEITATGVHFALRDNLGNVITYLTLAPYDLRLAPVLGLEQRGG